MKNYSHNIFGRQVSSLLTSVDLKLVISTMCKWLSRVMTFHLFSAHTHSFSYKVMQFFTLSLAIHITFKFLNISWSCEY
jgi:hypothetical protein